MKINQFRGAALWFFALFSAQPVPAFAAGIYYSEIGFGDSVDHQEAAPTVATGSHTTLISLPGGTRDPRGIAVDRVNGKIYYGDGLSIARMNLDGSSPTTLISLAATPGDIEVDPIGARIYYSTLFAGAGNGVFSANLDGSGVATIHTNASLALDSAPATVTVNDIYNLSLDSAAGLLYWTADDGGVAGRIGLNVSSTSGGGVSQLFVGTSRGDSIDRMDIDFTAGDVYYSVGSGTDEIRRSALSGGAATTLVSGLGRPSAVALDLANDELYFFVGGRLYQRGLDGTPISDKLILGGSAYAVSDMQVVPEPTSWALAVIGWVGSLLCFRWRRSSPDR